MSTSQSSTNTPLPQVGDWVQLNMQPYSSGPQPGVPYPTAEERSMGIVRSSYTAQGRQLFQVVWNPRGAYPQTGLYSLDQLVALSPQQAQQIQTEMASGSYTPQGGP